MKVPAPEFHATVRLLKSILILLFLSLWSASPLWAQGAGYWHTSGSQILDTNNTPVRIAGINWYGFETTDLVVHGLTSQDYKSILQTIQTQGFNTIRLPFSNQMVETPGTNLNISYYGNYGPINTDLKGLNSLQVMDKIVAYAGTIGLKIILDNHRSEAGNSAESNGLWYTSSYPESNWIADWQALANRYAGNPTVIGMDLRNEPHNAYSGGSCWDCGGANDWHLAAARGGNAVLGVNPNLLIFVEGTDAYNNDYYWWGGNLEGVANSPVTLAMPNRLVYSAHDYGPDEYAQTWFNGDSAASLQAVWTQHWAYISQAGTAPVWVGEFGTGNTDSDVVDTASGSQGLWFSSLVSFLKANPTLNWTCWALNGEDSYGLLDNNYDATPVDALKESTLQTIQFPLNTGSSSSSAKPTAPSSLTASAASSSEIDLAWTPSTTSGVTYSVYFGTSSGSIGTLLASGVTSASYAATGLNASTTYYFTVQAVNASGSSAVSNTASASTPAAATPAAPTGLTATAISASQINLAWISSGGAGITYSVYMERGMGGSANQLASGLTGTSYSATGLSAGTTYYFWIVASSSGGSSAPTSMVPATTQSAAAPAPGNPSGLTGTAISSTQINLGWAASSTSGVTYNLYAGTSASSMPLLARNISGTSYSATGLTAGTTYFFNVLAVSSGGVNSAQPSNTFSVATSAASTAAPGAPFGVSASPASASQINLSWQPSSTAGVTYNVYSGTVSGSTPNLAGSGLNGQSFSVTGLLDGTTYYFTVKAVANGVASATSNQASATTQTLPSTPPANLTATTASATEIDLSWSAVPNTGATYAIFYGTSTGAENTQLATGITGLSYAATGLSSATTYYFVVRSISGGGTSSPSAQASATTLSAGSPVAPPATSVPTAPTGLTATATSSSQIALSWTASATSGVTYSVYSGANAGSIGVLVASGLTSTAWSAAGLTPSTAYFYAVTAVNSAGASPASNAASATTQAPPAPTAPTGLTATATSASQIALSWTASSTSGVSYSVFSGASSGAESTLLASGLSGSSYAASSLSPSTAYFFTVQAVSGATSSTASNEAGATTQAAATGACHVAYLNQDDWGAGFTGGLSITNNSGTAWTSWTLTWTFAGNQQITQSWSSNYAQSGQKVTLTSAAWNGSVAAAGTVSGIGWNADYSGTNTNPTQFSVNGVACQ